jgi:hypothetical protein
MSIDGRILSRSFKFKYINYYTLNSTIFHLSQFSKIEVHVMTLSPGIRRTHCVNPTPFRCHHPPVWEVVLWRLLLFTLLSKAFMYH